MALKDDVEAAIRDVLNAPWNFREGRIVPDTNDVALRGGGVELDCTVLYSDLAESSTLVDALDRRVAAKIIKAFLAGACLVITANGGVVTSFDGDRVMAIYVGERKNTNAAISALKINYVVKDILVPQLASQFASVKSTGFQTTHCTGVDTGTAIAVRAGIRGSNDLIWIGRAPNLAAKLSDLRDDGYASYITADVFNVMRDEAKLGGAPRQAMWQEATWTWKGQRLGLYRSTWKWTP